MKNTDKLIAIYFYICECYDTELVTHCQRMSNNYAPKFTDQEVITIFLYAMIVEKKKDIKGIYEFAGAGQIFNFILKCHCTDDFSRQVARYFPATAKVVGTRQIKNLSCTRIYR